MVRMRSLCIRVALVLLAQLPGALASNARAGGLALVGHLGGVSAKEEIDGLSDLDWKTGVADLALEGSLIGPLWAGAGGEALLDTDRLAVSSKEAAFAYLKVRVPLPLSPYVGYGLELRRASIEQADGSTDTGWHHGRVFLAGVGFKLVRVSLDLEFRATRTDYDTGVLHVYSVRPGVTVWF